MPRTRRAVLGIVAASTLAGCLDNSGSGNTPTDSPTASPTDGGMAGADVAVSDHADLGQILVDGDGMTLYMFDSDEQGGGASSCSGGCADNWPPLTVDGEPTAGDGVTADLSTIERDDGSTQVTADGWPLYYFASDTDAGDTAGQGVGDVWWVLRPDGTPVRADATPSPTPMATPDVQVRDHADHGEILVGGEEMTLYMFDSDEQGAGASTCSGGCADNWPPLIVDGDPNAGDGVTADLSTFERGDGSTQVAASGWPLYFFASDSAPGDAAGQGVGDAWWVLSPDGTPQRGGSGGGY